MSSGPPPARDENRTLPTRPELSVTQVVASMLAAVSATIVASFFGVAGTVIGAALASVVTVVGNVVYSRSIRRVRGALPSRGARAPLRLNWRHAAFGAVGLFVVVAGIVTGVELAAGRPLSKIVHDRSGSGTSLFGGVHRPSSPAPDPASPTPTPSTSHSTPTTSAPTTHPASTDPRTPPSTTPSTTPSATPTPSPTPTTSAPASPTGTPTPTTGPSTP